MKIESGIVVFWLLPVAVQIILPLIMLLFSWVVHLFAGVIDLKQPDKRIITAGIQSKSRLPTVGTTV